MRKIRNPRRSANQYWLNILNQVPNNNTGPLPPGDVNADVENGYPVISWDTVAEATYNLYRSTTSGDETLYQSDINTNSYTDMAITYGVAYFYKVSSVVNSVESTLSSEFEAIGIAPAILSATAGDTQVVLSWTALAGAVLYPIGRSLVSGEEALLTTVSSPGYTDHTVVNGTTYYYEFYGVNEYGFSALSNEVVVTPTAP